MESPGARHDSFLSGRRACEACRRKKIRCASFLGDMVQPSCGLCTRIKKQCLYPHLRASSAADLQVPEALSASEGGNLPIGDTSGFFDSQNIEGSSHIMNFDSLDQPYADSRESSSCPSISSQLNVSTEVITNLVELFFSHVQPWLPIFHKPTFLQTYMDRYEEGTGAQPKELSLGERLIFYSMFALAARFSDLPDFAEMLPANRGKSFTAQAVRVYSLCRDGLEEASMHHLQGSILLAFLLQTDGSSSKAWVLTGIVIRLAYEMELDKTDHGDRNIVTIHEWIQLEERRRAWWLVWELDTFASFTCNRSYAIPREEFAVFLPISDERWFSGTPTASATLKSSPEEAWKSLIGSENQNPRAWFLVANYLTSIALTPQPKNEQEKLTINLSIHCFRVALPEGFHLPFQIHIPPDQLAERNWVISTHLLLSAQRVLQVPAGVSESISTGFNARMTSLRAFSAELSYIVDSWPSNASATCQPLVAWTLLSSHHLTCGLPDSVLGSSVNLGRVLIEELLKKFANTWHIGKDMLKAIKINHALDELTEEDKKILKRFSKFIPSHPSPGITSKNPQSDFESNLPPTFQPWPGALPGDDVYPTLDSILISDPPHQNQDHWADHLQQADLFLDSPGNDDSL